MSSSATTDLRKRILAHVEKQPGRTMSEIAAGMHCKKSQIERSIHALTYDKNLLFKDSLNKYYIAPTSCLLAEIYAPPVIPNKSKLRRVEFPGDWKADIAPRKRIPSISSGLGVDFKRYGAD